MQKRKTTACVIAVLAAVVLTVLRVLVMPRVATGGSGVLNTVLFVLSLAVIAVLLTVAGKTVVSVRARVGAAAGAVFLGISLPVSSVAMFLTWRATGLLPYPSDANPSALAELFTTGMILFGLLGGVFFVLQGAAWYGNRRLRGVGAWLSLAPLAWVWMRVCQYEISYYSSLTVFRQWYDLLLLLAEMLLFLSFARYTMGAGEKPHRLVGLSLSAAVMATMACVTRAVMALRGEQAAFDACALLTAPDLGVAVFGFAFAFGCRFAEPDEDEDDEDDEDIAQPSADEEPPLLVTDAQTSASEDDEDEEFDEPRDDRQPLELEDVLLNIFREMDNGQK